MITLFGDRLRSLRNEKNMTQSDLSKLLNVSPSTIGMYEQDRRDPDTKTLAFLADYFNVSSDYLLGIADIKNKQNKSKLPIEFTTPEEAMKFILEQNVIMGFEGFDIDKLSDDEIIEFANELLRRLQLLSYKYKK